MRRETNLDGCKVLNWLLSGVATFHRDEPKRHQVCSYCILSERRL